MVHVFLKGLRKCLKIADGQQASGTGAVYYS